MEKMIQVFDACGTKTVLCPVVETGVSGGIMVPQAIIDIIDKGALYEQIQKTQGTQGKEGRHPGI